MMIATEPALAEITANQAITTDVRDRFHEDGCLVVRGLFAPAQVSHLQAEAKRIVETWPDRLSTADWLRSGYPNQWGVFSEHISGLEKVGGEFVSLTRDHPRVQGILNELFAPTPMAPLGLSMQIMYGNCGCKQPWHQDHTPGDSGLWWVRCLFYIDELTEENGSLLLIPGSHKTPLTRRMPDYGPVPGSVRVTCPAGTVVIFYQGLLHAADENRTDRTRRGLLTNFHAQGMKVFGGKGHEARFSRGVRRGPGPISSTPTASGNYYFS